MRNNSSEIHKVGYFSCEVNANTLHLQAEILRIAASFASLQGTPHTAMGQTRTRSTSCTACSWFQFAPDEYGTLFHSSNPSNVLDFLTGYNNDGSPASRRVIRRKDKELGCSSSILRNVKIPAVLIFCKGEISAHFSKAINF